MPPRAPVPVAEPTDPALIARLMDRALALAEGAAAAGEVPVGAVVADAAGRIWGEGANAPIGRCDPTAHAEVLALRAAAIAYGNYRLTGLILAVTLEPCAMCAAAISFARIGTLVYAATDPKGGAVRHGPRLYAQPTLHHRPDVHEGPGAEASATLLRTFFQARR